MALDGMSTMRERVGLIRLDSVPASDARHARTFTEYIGGPRPSVTVRLVATGLRRGGVAGLALSHNDVAWVGVERESDGFVLAQFDERAGRTARIRWSTPHVWLRLDCEFASGAARFGYSASGSRYAAIGEPYLFGGGQPDLRWLCCSLFAYHTPLDGGGGHAEFDSFLVTWLTAGSGLR